jgi:hypothetical protein
MPAVPPAWRPDLPQGCAKKIQLDLLLADLALQLRYPLARTIASPAARLPSHRWRFPRPAAARQCR